jgi:predicted TIM-barrel fold metal-dependent hydrolase
MSNSASPQPSLIENSRPLAPHNRLGLEYRDVPPRKVSIPGGIIDAHNHTREVEVTRPMVEAARAYGVTEFWTMAPLEFVKPLQEAFPGQFHFIAIPAWQRAMKAPPDAEFFKDWRDRVEQFAALGARLIKFHSAPGTMRRWETSLDDPRIREIARAAYDLGYHFMTHIGDPKAWFFGKGVYADGTYGTFESQFDQLERFLELYPDRLHLGAHMGGSLEDLERLARRLEKYPHYVVDMSATKWMLRGATEQSAQGVRDFFVAFQDRIVFGSDLVVGEKYSWDHYASRYWALQQLWETTYDGESPIEDPDGGQGFDPKRGVFDASRADGVPRIKGVDLPVEVLKKIYRTNAKTWLPG